MEDLLIRYRHWSENTLNEVFLFLPSVYELYVVVLILILLIGFYRFIVLNRKYTYLYRFFAKIIDAIF